MTLANNREDTHAFDFWGNRVESWLDNAISLHLAYMTLNAQRQLISNWKVAGFRLSLPRGSTLDLFALLLPEMMLAGLKIELLLKTLILVENTKLVEDGKYIGPSTHNLRRLTEVANFPISDEEGNLLDFLSDVILYLGRYPVPKNINKEIEHWRWSGDEESTLAILWSRLLREIRPRYPH